MGSKSNMIVGLDIGTTKVSVLIADVTPGAGANGGPKVEVIGMGSSPSRGLRKGVVINIESTVDAISKAVTQAETMAGVEVANVFASIGGGHIKSMDSHGIVGIKNREVTISDIERVIEAAKAVAIPMDREILHVLPQEFIVDEQDGIKEPIGMNGVRLEARVHIITGAVASAQNVVKCANRCGLTVKDVVLGHLASAESVLSAEERELGVCLIDIGGGTTDILVLHNGAVRYTTVLPVGGNHITNDIAAGLRTPIAAAEHIKCKHGTAVSSGDRSDEIIEVPSTGGRPPRVISKQVLAEIIEPRIEEIFNLVHRELVKTGCDEFLTSGVVLCGGSAGLYGISDIAEQVFNLPVRVGHPTGVQGIAELVSPPEYATAVGLLMYGSKNQTALGIRGRDSGIVSGLFKKVHEWFG